MFSSLKKGDNSAHAHEDSPKTSMRPSFGNSLFQRNGIERSAQLAYFKNFALALQLANKIKSTVISSNDIISDKDLPIAIRPSDFDSLRLKHGSEAFDSYLRYTEKLNFIRKSMLNQDVMSVSANRTARVFAVGLLGLGEGEELATHLIIELIKAKRNDCVLLQLISDLSISKDSVIVILGLSNPPTSFNGSLATFLNQLPDQCVVIDLNQNYIGHPKHLLQESDDYYKKYQLNKVRACVSFAEKTVESALAIESNAIDIAKVTRIKPSKPSDFFKSKQLQYLFHLPSSLNNTQETVSFSKDRPNEEQPREESRHGLFTI